MDKVNAFISKIQAIWVAIGTVIALLAAQGGINLPDFLSDVFSQAFLDAVGTAVGSVIVFYQYLRAIFASKTEGEIQILSTGAKTAYALNPFKLKAA